MRRVLDWMRGSAVPFEQMSRIRILVLCFLTCICGAIAAPKGRTGQAPDHANVKYGRHERNVLDVWKAKSDTPAPVVIYFHGGGFLMGDKSYAGGVVPKLVKSGITVVSANYRFCQPKGVTIREIMQDGARAIQFVRHNAKDWNIDPERVALMGVSAGGCMSVWLGLHDDLANPKSKDPVERQSTRVTCVVGEGSQTLVDPQIVNQYVPGGDPMKFPSVRPLFDIENADDLKKPEVRRLATEYSAINHASKDDPPLFLSYRQNLPTGMPKGDKIGNMIHSPLFGMALMQMMVPLGVECTVDTPAMKAGETKLAFLQRQLKVKK